LKGFMDGSLGSQTAYMFDPYTNGNGTGLLITPLESVQNWTLFADRADLQVSVHAIGDKANYLLLNIYKNITETTPLKDRRFRIEHAQHVRFADIPLFTRYSIIASMQPYHIIDDGCWAESLIGPDRIKYTYPMRTMLDNEVNLAFGSDWDVAPAVPLKGLYAAVTRATLDGKNPGGWVPDEKIELEEAMKAYTIGAAYSEFSEGQKGLLKEGYLADLVMIDRNIFKIPAEQIWNATVVMTMVNGIIKYQDTKF